MTAANGPALVAIGQAVGVQVDPDLAETDVDRLLYRLGPARRLVEATVRNSANPTMLRAGYKVNVIPGSATAGVDGRVLPGFEDEFEATMEELTGGTDAKQFSRLGVTGYGFSPLRLPAGFDPYPLVHGVDERVPVDALQFGVRVLDRFLSTVP